MQHLIKYYTTSHIISNVIKLFEFNYEINLESHLSKSELVKSQPLIHISENFY